jgi:hypothetical protein
LRVALGARAVTRLRELDARRVPERLIDVAPMVVVSVYFASSLTAPGLHEQRSF